MAHEAVNEALRKGDLKRPKNCTYCSKKAVYIRNLLELINLEDLKLVYENIKNGTMLCHETECTDKSIRNKSIKVLPLKCCLSCNNKPKPIQQFLKVLDTLNNEETRLMYSDVNNIKRILENLIKKVKKIEAHHSSYEIEHWLDVIWCCVKCHREMHHQKTPRFPLWTIIDVEINDVSELY